MLHPDVSTADALRLLSRTGADEESERDAGPRGWSRRRFLQAVGMGVGAGLTIGSLGETLFGGDVPEAWAGSPIGAGDGILVNVMFFGGNDGLNTVVPYTNGSYYAQRSNIAIPASTVLALDGSFGLHPSLAYIKALYDAGQVGVVHNVGYPKPDLSHFSSMAIWMHGRYGGGAPTSGWLGRWLDGQPEAAAGFAAATVGSSVPLHLIGVNRRALGVPESGGMFGSKTDATSLRLYSGVSAMANASGGRGPWHDAFSATMRTTIDVATELSPAFTPDIAGGPFVKKLTMAARLINRNIGLRVVDVGVGGFDHHDGEPYRHAQLLQDFNDGVEAFFATLDPAFLSRVTMITGSEFGRTPYSNSSTGTDHGTTAAHFVIGPNVRGGMYGQPPDLGSLRSQWDRLPFTAGSTDFRSIYGSVLDGWLGGGASTILNGSFQNLNLFNGPPGSGSAVPPGGSTGVIAPSAPTVPNGAASTFVPMSPQRVLDTRDGTGGRLGVLNPDESWSFALAGRYGIPADATAVALNVTADGATEPTFITVWPVGMARPITSNLNPVPGMAVPNMVVTRVGDGGGINLYNLKGTVHLIADVVGYFRAGSTSDGLVPLRPQRLLDTRDGTGGRLGKLAASNIVDVVVVGRGGVPANASAVVLNVTVTEPSAAGFLSVFPTGDPLPTASSVNMVAGQTVPNMVTAKVGVDGQVSIYNYAGTTDVVIDVLGCFVPGAPGRFVAVGPVRLLDTREGLSAPKQRVDQKPLSLKITGRAGVPAAGVSGVLLNVTAVEPTANTFVTVYPGGSDLPTASNLNAVTGQIVPNMVLAMLGPSGNIQLKNYAGTVDLVADVFGYFTD